MNYSKYVATTSWIREDCTCIVGSLRSIFSVKIPFVIENNVVLHLNMLNNQSRTFVRNSYENLKIRISTVADIYCHDCYIVHNIIIHKVIAYH